MLTLEGQHNVDIGWISELRKSGKSLALQFVKQLGEALHSASLNSSAGHGLELIFVISAPLLRSPMTAIGGTGSRRGNGGFCGFKPTEVAGSSTARSVDVRRYLGATEDAGAEINGRMQMLQLLCLANLSFSFLLYAVVMFLLGKKNN